MPTWTESLAATASRPIGGPLGRHAAVGTHWFWSPLRVAMLLAVVALLFGWFGKAACIQQHETGDGEFGLDWRSGRPYVAMCYSDVVPLYGAERLDREDFLVYRDGWLELTNPEGGDASATVIADGDQYRVVAGQAGVTAVDSADEQFVLRDGDRITMLPGDRIRLADGREVTLRSDDELRFMEYPPLTGLFQWVNARLADAWLDGAAAGVLPGAIPVAVYFNITALFLAFAWLATVWAVARTARRRPWDAVLVAISPLVVVHAFTNFDTLATAAAAGAVLAWSRRRPVVAGVLIGLGAAAKLYPLFLLGPLLVLCLRVGKLRSWAVTAVSAAFALLAVNVPLALLFPEGWREFLRLNAERGMDPDTLYNVVSSLTGWAGFDGPLAHNETPVLLNIFAGVLFLLCCLGVAYVALSAPVRPRLAQLCFLVVAAFLLTNKVWSPQFSLWLVPLAVLAIPHWRLLLGWMVVDALVWVPRMYFYLGTDEKGLPEQWFLGAVVLRDLVVLGLCALVVYQIYRPNTDLVRQSGDDDPAGGVLDRARDVRVLPRPQWLQRRDSRRKAMSSA
ncbi:MAG: glycosyltransferase family 87 protein [Thermocrispum sp.]